ncbi:hypothetical protein QVA60_01530 [Staphylococcus chromogenes]|uniref:hypothetical protein n=1 Tax=Staphylococcus chromogenes TaxID=46126 RepID=UPI0028FE54ED|nr:hypothetical protein [Staphylococcus chromogenes]MDU0429166.1 hypothetical protein [Staphylococcus chromogenes]
MEELKFDWVDLVQGIFVMTFIIVLFFLNCAFLIDPIKWLLVQIIFIVAPTEIFIGYAIRYFLEI